MRMESGEDGMVSLTEAEIANVNDYQVCGVLHELTCSVCMEPLVADESGLHCPRCRFRQSWVPNYILAGRWRRWVDHLKASPAGHFLMLP